jgi:prolyl oligopeptidase
MAHWLAFLVTPLMANLSTASERPTPPGTPVRAVVDTLHGVPVTDPYRWLEDAKDPEVEKWQEAQNAYTQATLSAWPGRAALAENYKSLFAINTALWAETAGKRIFLTKKDGLSNQPVLELRSGNGTTPGTVALDPNGFSADGTTALDWEYPSPDGSLLAYGKSEGGSEHSTLYVRDVTTGKDLGEAIQNTQHCALAWDPDGKGFTYSRHPAEGEVPKGEEVFHEQIFHHRLGDDPKQDSMVWSGEGAPMQEIRQASSSSDHQWVFLTTSTDWAKNDLYVRKAGTDAPFAPLAKGLDATFGADASHGSLYVMTNLGAPRYRIMKAAPEAKDPSTWTELVPEQKGVIQAFALIGGRLVLTISENALSRIAIYSLDGKFEKDVPLPTLGTVDHVAGEPDGDQLFFRFASYTYPSMVYRYAFASGKIAPIEPRPLPFDPAKYTTEQVWVTSKDGTKVPMFVVHQKGLKLDGARPTILYGYGGFNVSETPEFRAAIFPWLDHGGVWCDANLRGGGEFGREWHEAGRLARKQNVFDDYYACGEWLIANHYTNVSRLATHGGSNGGLLVGAAITQRPDLWGAAVCEVPLLDMLRYQNFSIARYWVPEYGSSEDAEQFQFLRKYSPYQNVTAGTKYPPTLFTAGAEDSRVDALHARKMCALIQAQSGGTGPYLLRVESKAGHGQGKPTAKRIEAAVDVYGFLMEQFGMDAGPGKPTP